jgi:hypothetical protein
MANKEINTRGHNIKKKIFNNSLIIGTEFTWTILF